MLCNIDKTWNCINSNKNNRPNGTNQFLPPIKWVIAFNYDECRCSDLFLEFILWLNEETKTLKKIWTEKERKKFLERVVIYQNEVKKVSAILEKVLHTLTFSSSNEIHIKFYYLLNVNYSWILGFNLKDKCS